MSHSILLSTAAAVALVSGPALAQGAPQSAPPADASADAGSKLEDIVVTAQKREQNIQSVPLSIVSVSGDTLARAGINDPVALQKLVPSLQINNTFFGSGVVIRIRGFGSAANTAVDSEVAPYLDGAFVPRPGALLASFLDVKNVEVLNGPQGTLFGRNATLGAISINTNAPSTKARTASFTAEGGSYGTYGGSGVVNIPLSDTFAVRFAIKDTHTDGFYRNQLDGQRYGRNNNLVMRLSAKAEPAPNLTWTVRGDYTRSRGDGVYPSIVYTDTATPAALTALANFTTNNGGTPPVYSSPPSYTVNQFFPQPFARDRQYGVTSDLRWGVASNVELRLIDSYRDWKNDQLAGDTVGTTLRLLNVEIQTQSKAQSHELQLVSSKDAFLNHKLGVTAGLYYAREEYSLNTFFNIGNQFCPVILGRAGPVTVGRCQAAPQSNAAIVNFAQVAKSVAAYLQTDYEIVPSVSLALGVRHTRDRKSAAYQQIQNNFALGSLVINDGPNALTFRDNRTSVRASLSWNVTSQVMLFGTFSTGYKSGGFNSGGAAVALGAAARTFASETVEDYELGLKSTLLDGKARLNVTLFNTKLKNFQDRSFNGTGFVVRNSGDVRSRGVDLDSQLLIARDFKLTFGATYLNSIYTNNTGAPGLEGCTGLAGCPTFQNLTGQRLPFAPKLQGTVGAEWKSGPIMNGISVGFGASEHFTSGFLTANNDNPQSRVPGYATTDLRASLISADGKWQFDLFGQNVFNRHYFVTTVAQVLGAAIGVNSNVTGTTLYRGFLGSPATYGARVSLNF